jgi:large subunit ribosomal protein L23
LELVKDPHTIIIQPHITEKAMRLSQGDPRVSNIDDVERSYTFIVATDANKIEIKAALEAIYNVGKKPADHISVQKVRTIKVHGKSRRVGQRSKGMRPDWKKAVVTLAKGQMIEDFGV